MARGIAFLSASGGEDLQKLVRHVALAQGAFDVFAGGTKAFTNLAAVLGGPVSGAIVGTTALLSIGALQWNKYKSAAEAAEKAAREASEKTRAARDKQIDSLFNLDRAQRRLAGSRGDMLIEGGLTSESQAARKVSESRRLAREVAGLQAELRHSPDTTENRINKLLEAQLKYKQPGSEGALREAVEGSPDAAKRVIAVNRDLADTLEQRWRIEKDLADTQVAHGKEQADAFKVASGAALGFGQLANPAFAAATTQVESQYKDMVTRLQKPLEQIVKAIEAAADRAARIEKDLNGANPE